MRHACGSVWIHIAMLVLIQEATAAASEVRGTPMEVRAGAPTDVSVTVYRAPRSGGSMDLDELQGFALVTETRTVHIPAGEGRLRFDGVADGIEPASAIVTGLPAIIEKNRDAELLSPAALVAAAVGKAVVLLRTNKKTGVVDQLRGTIKSDADGGVLYETADGIEALRCSGLPETFSFSSVLGLAATPSLSVLVRTPADITATVTLSYLSGGFDWAADYVATLSPDGKTMGLGAWVTLANSNGVSFPAAHAQVVAGRLNRETGVYDPVEAGAPIIASCWPQGSTSDTPMPGYMMRADAAARMSMPMMKAMVAGSNAEVIVTAQRVQQEQLGDLKLYRVPDRTTVASRQSKQVRLLDKLAIPVQTVYRADVFEGALDGEAAANLVLRTKNDEVHHLGLPLPSGRAAIFATDGKARVLVGQSDVHDLAVDEDVEFDLGPRADVRIRAVKERAGIDTAHARVLPLVPGVSLRSVRVSDVERVEISNARGSDIQFELRLQLPDGARVVRADHALSPKNGRPVFRLVIPANGAVTVRYQVERTA
jgi:hypothetical protein